MSERDKYTWQAEALKEFAEWLCREIPGNSIISDPNWWAPRIFNAVLRALAAQQEPVPPLDGPKCEHGYPLSAPSCPLCGGSPQASAPAEQPKCKTCGGSGLVNIMTTNEGPDSQFEDVDCPRCDASGIESATPTETDLDALVARLKQGASISRDRNINLDYAKVADQAAQAITDLRAQLGMAEHANNKQFATINGLRAHLNIQSSTIYNFEQGIALRDVRITRLEADNAEAREFAAQVIEDALYRDSSGTRTRDGSMYCQHCNERNEEKTQHAENCMVNRAKAFLAKQGDTQ